MRGNIIKKIHTFLDNMELLMRYYESKERKKNTETI